MKPTYSKRELEQRKIEAELRHRTDRKRYFSSLLSSFDNRMPTALVHCTKEEIKLLQEHNDKKIQHLEGIK